jgi:galactose mutarotase-like enzyme
MYECRDGEILTTLQVSHNDVGLSDNTPAPVNIALHPYFTTVRTSVSVGPHIARFSDEFYDITYCEGNPITIPTPAGDIVMELGDEYAMLRFWSDNPQKYRCVEPVMGDTSEFNTMRGISIKAGETLTISMRMILR